MALAGFSSAVLLATACVDPENDYDDYLSRTADARANPPESDASEEVTLPEGAVSLPAFSGPYIMWCVSQALNDNAKLPTIFAATLSFTPAASGGGGTLDFADTPLQVGATNNGQVTGAAASLSNVPVTPEGTCDLAFGLTNIPANADPTGAGPIVFGNLTLHLVISSPTNICAATTGDLEQPDSYPVLQGPENPCMLLPYTGSVTAPASYSCPYYP